MPTVRFFGPLAEAAGARRLQVEGTHLEEVLFSVARVYGEHFSEQAKACKVWVNGEPAHLGVILSEDDEIALLPPVSGGCWDD